MSGPEGFRNKLVKTITSIDELLADYQFATVERPDMPLQDVEPLYLQRDGLRKALAAFDNGEPINPEWLQCEEGGEESP